LLPPDQVTQIAETFAADFIAQLHLDNKLEQKCEWSCILWLKDHWAEEARKAKMNLHQTKEKSSASLAITKTTEALFINSQFLSTAARVYSKLFNAQEKTCAVKSFQSCPCMDERQDYLNKGSLATVFVTILQKATFYAMLDRHPLDSGLLDEEYNDVYGVDLTDYQDLERSLTDGRFERLYEAVVKRGTELAGFRPEQPH
jgi:hypothetical protein